MKFKVGDKVVFRSKSGSVSISPHRDGHSAEIAQVVEDDTKLPYFIKFGDENEMWTYEDHLELSTEKNIMLTHDASEHLSKRLIDDLNAENAKLGKQIKLLKIMLHAQGYESLAIASALELLE